MSDYEQRFKERFLQDFGAGITDWAEEDPDYKAILTFIDSVYQEAFEAGKNYSNSKRPGYHGMGKHPMYHSWSTMLQRCTNPKDTNYKHYGARGITVCDRWRDFKNFRDDMLPTWEEGLTLDRVDVNGNYEPGNCAWATRAEQSNNKRTNVVYMYEGKIMNMSQWAKEKGLPVRTVRDRLQRLGWSIEDALNTPVDLGNKYNRHDD